MMTRDERTLLPAKCVRCGQEVVLEFNPLRWRNLDNARTHTCPRKQRKA